jgi:nucleoside-diphosphate-sugar epimerase
VKVLVTGGSGLAGRHITPLLLDAGHEVVSVDTRPPDGGFPGAAHPAGARYVQVDTTDFGQVVAVTSGVDAVVHLAAIPNPLWRPEHEVFRINILSSWNVLEAAEVHGVPKVVMASSVNAIGASFWERQPREYFPFDEQLPTKATDAYAQSKWLGEEMGQAFCRRRPMQVASLRYHGLWPRERQAAWNASAEKDSQDAERYARNYWSWVDLDEAALAAVLAVENDWAGHEAFFIQADDSVATTPTEELLDRWYPEAERKARIAGFGSPISNEKAKRVLGWVPAVTWRDA